MSGVGQVALVSERSAEFSMFIESLTRSMVQAGIRSPAQQSSSAPPESRVLEQLSDPDRARELADAISDAVRNLNIRVGFGVYEETGRIYVKVLDKLSGALIKTIPPEEFLKLAAKLIEVRRALGLMVDVNK